MKTIGQTLQTLEINCFVTLTKIPSAGSLQARRQTATGAITFLWRITGTGKSFRYVIGRYDPTAPPKSLTPTGKGYSIAAAISTATAWGELHNAHLEIGGYPGYLDKQEQDTEVSGFILTPPTPHNPLIYDDSNRICNGSS